MEVTISAVLCCILLFFLLFSEHCRIYISYMLVFFLAIHRAAGPELREACYNVPEVQPGVRCPTGEARITPYVLLLQCLFYQSFHFKKFQIGKFTCKTIIHRRFLPIQYVKLSIYYQVQLLSSTMRKIATSIVSRQGKGVDIACKSQSSSYYFTHC